MRKLLPLRASQLMECRQCQLRYTDVYGSHESIVEYYSRIQAHHGKLDNQEAQLRSIARTQADAIDLLCGVRRQGRILEVGCSRGHLLEVLEERGWESCGVDLSATSADEARSRVRGSVHEGILELLPMPTDHFDVVAMFDVLAHLPQPMGTLNAIAKTLRPGGFLVLSTVNESWPLVPVFQALFRTLPASTEDLRDEMYEGQHYCYFGEDTVGRLVEEAGLQLLEVRPLQPLSARFFAHQYSWRRRLALQAMARADQLLGSSRKMLVLARKPAACSA